MKQQRERKPELKARAVLIVLFGLWGACTQPTNTKVTDDIGNDNETPSSKTVPALIYRSIDVGKTWLPYATGIPQEATVSSFLSVDNAIYTTTDTHGIYLIEEGDTKWKRVDVDLPDKVDINAITSINNIFIIGTHKHGILISHNNGMNWQPSSSPLSHPIRCLLSYNSSVFAGADDGIYRSMDQGNTWQHVYAMTLGSGLLRSNDDGYTWENFNGGFGETRWYTFDVKNLDDQLFAAQWHGIYSKKTNDDHWQIIKNGLPDSTAFSTLETTPFGLIAGIGLRKN